MQSRIERSLDDNRPTVVLYSAVPMDGYGWEQLHGHSCGGFSCEYLDGWAYLLPLRAEIEPAIRAIAGEEFCLACANPSLDYYGGSAERHEQQAAYRAFVERCGLTVNDGNLDRLKQAAYPLDATPDNLRVLVGTNRVPDPSGGMVLLVLGDNCD